MPKNHQTSNGQSSTSHQSGFWQLNAIIKELHQLSSSSSKCCAKWHRQLCSSNLHDFCQL